MERIELRTRIINGREYLIIVRWIETSPEETARRRDAIARAVAQSLLRQSAPSDGN